MTETRPSCPSCGVKPTEEHLAFDKDCELYFAGAGRIQVNIICPEPNCEWAYTAVYKFDKVVMKKWQHQRNSNEYGSTKENNTR